MIRRESCFRLRPDVRYRIIDEEAVVIRQDAGEVVVLNPVGARVLHLVGPDLEVRALIERMAREYAASAQTLEAEVLGFLEELVAAGVIEEVPSHGA